MNLIIDIGNTRTKIAVFNGCEMIHTESFTNKIAVSESLNVAKKYTCSHAIISSVGAVKKEAWEILSSKIKVHILSYKSKLPFVNSYATPKTLGADRMALAAAAASKFPHKNVLVIDAGTCITYDFVNSKTHYLGGAISLGIQMRYKALHNFTEKLPLLLPKNTNQLYGNTTEDSIHLGVVNGLVYEIEGVVNSYKEKNKY